VLLRIAARVQLRVREAHCRGTSAVRQEPVEEFYSTHKTKASAKRLVSPIFSRSAPESNPLPLDGTAFHPHAALRGTTLVAG